jgi:hypothetical protein
MIAGLRGAIAAKMPEPILHTVYDLLQGRTKPQSALRASVARRHHRSELQQMDANVIPVQRAGATVLSRQVARFSATWAISDLLDLVMLAADEATIPHKVIRSNRNQPCSVVLESGAAAESFLASFNRLAAGRPFYAQVDGLTAPVLLTQVRAAHISSLTIFEWLSADGTILAGPELGCRLLFGRETGSLPLITDVIEPVDVVYTWVDGNDPVWRRQKTQALSLQEPQELNEFAANDERYRPHDELRFSLRSLDYFAPWVNHVYLVTAGQVPDWLDTANPRITVVDHADIFPWDALPTFNSHAIEARLHHIPGLSEHFLYLNDDVLFGRHVFPELFFHGNGLAKFFFSRQTVDDSQTIPGDLPVDSAAKQNRMLLQERFGRTPKFKFMHAAHPQLVSTLEALEKDFESKHAETTRSKFRSPKDISIPSSLAHYYGYGIGAAVPGDIDYRYCDIGEIRARAKLLRLLRKRDADVFCLNEIGGSAMEPAKQDEMVQHFLRSYFPVPGSFERKNR